MSGGNANDPTRTPTWVWAVAAVLAATQPLLCLWTTYAPPAGLVSTGLHVPDSALFLHAMRMFRTGFESLYATCQSPYGTHSIAYFPLPHLWLYGALGAVARLAALPDFIAYGLANGLGAFVYLLVVYALLREVAPKQANLAFLLYTLSGGFGGILYVATGAFGLHAAPGFEDYFRRYALYELFEGAHLQPLLCFPRLYYTVSLALCLGALTLLARGVRRARVTPVVAAGLLMVPGAFINLRYGVFTLALAALFLYAQSERPARMRPARTRYAYGALLAAPAAVGAALALALLRTNPVAIRNHHDVASQVMYLSPFLSVVALHLLVVPGEAARRIGRLPLMGRVAAFGATGYLTAFAALFLAYQVYYGNVLVARDAAVAVAVSDWALLGACAGAAYALARRGRSAPASERDWVVLWLLFFLALAISAFGRGWFLQFGPQRLQIFLWLPICVLSAAGLERWRKSRPRAARGLTAAMVACGLTSAAVTVLCFQGPLGYRPGASPYAAFHAEVMTEADAAVMAHVGAGIVLAPLYAADVIAMRRGNRVVFGVGSFNCSDQRFVTLRAQVADFFSPAADDPRRRQCVRDWCVGYVYCPDTWPVDADTVEQLRSTPWLHEVAAEGRAVLFEVAADRSHRHLGPGSSSG